MVKANHTDLADLPPSERAICYRQFAKQAETWAENARIVELAASYRLLGKQWNKLAEHLAPRNGDYPSSVAIQTAQATDPDSDQRH